MLEAFVPGALSEDSCRPAAVTRVADFAAEKQPLRPSIFVAGTGAMVARTARRSNEYDGASQSV